MRKLLSVFSFIVLALNLYGQCCCLQAVNAPTNSCVEAQSQTGPTMCEQMIANPNHPLANADCDNGGQTNLEECLAGKNPFDGSDDGNAPTGCDPGTNTAPSAVLVVDCTSTSQGSISEPTTTCSEGATLEYQVDGGPWTTTLPNYNDNDVHGDNFSINVRCNCDGNLADGPKAQTDHSGCADCTPGSSSPVVVSDNDCTTNTLGTIEAPSACAKGETLEYQLNGGPWTQTLPSYDPDNAITICTRCQCDGNTSTPVCVTTSPTACPQIDVLCQNGCEGVEIDKFNSVEIVTILNGDFDGDYAGNDIAGAVDLQYSVNGGATTTVSNGMTSTGFASGISVLPLISNQMNIIKYWFTSDSGLLHEAFVYAYQVEENGNTCVFSVAESQIAESCELCPDPTFRIQMGASVLSGVGNCPSYQLQGGLISFDINGTPSSSVNGNIIDINGGVNTFTASYQVLVTQNGSQIFADSGPVLVTSEFTAKCKEPAAANCVAEQGGTELWVLCESEGALTTDKLCGSMEKFTVVENNGQTFTYEFYKHPDCTTPYNIQQFSPDFTNGQYVTVPCDEDVCYNYYSGGGTVYGPNNIPIHVSLIDENDNLLHEETITSSTSLTGTWHDVIQNYVNAQGGFYQFTNGGFFPESIYAVNEDCIYFYNYGLDGTNFNLETRQYVSTCTDCNSKTDYVYDVSKETLVAGTTYSYFFLANDEHAWWWCPDTNNDQCPEAPTTMSVSNLDDIQIMNTPTLNTELQFQVPTGNSGDGTWSFDVVLDCKTITFTGVY